MSMEAIPLSEALVLAKHLGPDYCVVPVGVDYSDPCNQYYPAGVGGFEFRASPAPCGVHDLNRGNSRFASPSHIYKHSTAKVNGARAVKWAMENPGKEFCGGCDHYRWSEGIGIEWKGHITGAWYPAEFVFDSTYTIPNWVRVTPEVREK